MALFKMLFQLWITLNTLNTYASSGSKLSKQEKYKQTTFIHNTHRFESAIQKRKVKIIKSYTIKTIENLPTINERRKKKLQFWDSNSRVASEKKAVSTNATKSIKKEIKKFKLLIFDVSHNLIRVCLHWK